MLLLWLLLISPSCWVEASAAPEANWNLIKDDPLEYSLQTSFTVADAIICLLQASISGYAEAVTFDEAARICNLFKCKWGESGCRKCRNMNLDAGTMFWTKRLELQDRRSCWRTFQHRVDDSELFNRSWLQYQVGFGQGEQRNFWMGLDAIHEATIDGLRRVRWELNLWTGDPYWAENEHFVVAGAEDKYRLDLGPLDTDRSTLSMCQPSFKGCLFDRMFSTYDNDNDISGANCAVDYQSGWWFGMCHTFNPNGIYVNGPEAYIMNRSGPALAYTWPGSTAPFIFKYSMMRFECLFADFF